METISIMLAIITCSYALLRPTKSIALVVFLLPFGLLRINMGATLSLAEVTAAFTSASTFLRFNDKVELPRWLKYYFIFLNLSVFVGLISLAKGLPFSTVPQAWSANGIGRILIQYLKFLLWAFFCLAIWNKRAHINYIIIIRYYLYATTVLCILGIIQLLLIQTTGFNLFPLNGLEDGIATIGNSVRITSMAGEPKRLAMTIVVAFTTIIAFSRVLKLRKGYLYLMIGLYTLTLALTLSSSGFFTLFISLFLYFFFKTLNRPLRKKTHLSTCLFALIAIAFCFIVVIQTNSTRGTQYKMEDSNILELIEAQTIGRFKLDDTDSVYSDYFNKNPERILFGVGLGLGHMAAMDLIPQEQQYYMFGTTMPPKSGVMEAVIDSGAFGLLFLGISLYFLAYPNTLKVRRSNKFEISYQYFTLSMIVIFALRQYDIFSILILFTVMAASKDFETSSHKIFQKFHSH